MEEILTRSADPIKVKLIKGQRDTYSWEISVQGSEKNAILLECLEIDAKLRGDFSEGRVSEGGEL